MRQNSGGTEYATSRREPVAHDVGDQVRHARVLVVEGGQLAVAFPVRVAGQALRHQRVGARDVVEHAIEHHVDAALAAGGHQVVEVLVGAQAGVDLEVVQRVIAVGHRFENRAEQQPVAAELDQVVQPGLELPQARRFVVLLADRCARGAQRVDVPPDNV